MGYVPKAEKVADATKENYLNSPSVQKTLQGTRERNAAREAANTPADMAAYKARVFDNYAKMQERDGKPDSAKMWRESAKEQEAKARQLGYKGDIAKATIKDPTAKPQSPASTASTPKPAPSTTPAKPTSSGRDWDKRPPVNDSEVIAYERDMAAAKPKPASSAAPKPSPQPPKPNAPQSAANYRANQQEAERKAIGFRPEPIKQSDIDSAKKRSESYKRDADIYNKHAQDYERQGNKAEAQRMKDMATRSEKGAQVAARNAADLEKNKSTREAEIAAWDEKKKKYDNASASEKKSMADIPKLSEPVKKEVITVDDPLKNLMKDLSPTLDNSSAYNTSGAGGGSGVAGFFTRDGKVIPITA